MLCGSTITWTCHRSHFVTAQHRDDDKGSEITAKVVELIESVINSTGTLSRTLPDSARSKEARQHRQT